MIFACVGGLNMDVTAQAREQMLMHDSNPGMIRFSPGGVGRNIAVGLRLAGEEVRLIAPVTRDLSGLALRKDCEQRGVDLSLAVEYGGNASGYVSLHTPDGDMLAAVHDMAAMDALTPEAVQSRLEAINACGGCVADANLTPETLKALADGVTVPLIADPVSVYKCGRLTEILPRLAAIKPNLMEASAMTGETDPARAAAALLKKGVQRVILSLGSEGVYAADAEGGVFLRPEKRYTCQTTGAGDTLCAGIAAGAARGRSAAECARRGMELVDRLLSERLNGQPGSV